MKNKEVKYSIAKRILQKFYRTYYRLNKKRIAKKKHIYLLKNGFEALVKFDKCLTDNGYPYTLAFGSLLGAIREHDFIQHDNDVDVTMWIDSYSPNLIKVLESAGFRHKYSYSVENDRYAKEDTFEYEGVSVDIFYIYRDSNLDSYCCYFVNQPGCTTRLSSVKEYGGLATRKIYLATNKDIIRIPFRGIEVPVPSNYDKVLKRVFGDDYLTPIPGWTHENYSESMPNWLCVYKEY